MDSINQQPLPENPVQQPIQNPPPDGALRFTKYLWIFLALLVLVAVGSATYFLGRNQSKSVAVVQSSPTPTPDPTASWKIYNDADYSFKYPADWIISSKSDLNGNLNTKPTLYYTENNKQYAFDVELYGKGLPNLDSKTSTATYGGKKFERIVYSNNNNPVTIFVIPEDQLGAKFTDIEIGLPPTNIETYVKTFDQILSTFKFTQ